MHRKYQLKIKDIMSKAMKDLARLKTLEFKYKGLDLSKYERTIFKHKRKMYRFELNKSISSLMLILINLKNVG